MSDAVLIKDGNQIAVELQAGLAMPAPVSAAMAAASAAAADTSADAVAASQAAAAASATSATASAASATASAGAADVSEANAVSEATNAANSASAAAASAASASTSASAASAWAGAAQAAEAAVEAELGGTPLASANIAVASRALLAAASHSSGLPAILTEAGREGVFVWSGANLSAKVTNDPNQGVYVAPSSDTTGASGAWVRKTRTITPFMFGAIGDGVANDRAALQAFNDFVFGATPRDEYADWTGNFAISGQLFIGPSSAPAGITVVKYPVGGDLRLTQLTATFESVRIRNLLKQNWQGGIRIVGIGSTNFASRTCAVGIALDNSGNCRFDWLTANYFWLAGLITASGNNDEIHFGHLLFYSCGSGQSVGSLAATYSSVTNNGSANSFSQTSTIGGVSAFPDPAITTYESIGNQALFVVIGGEVYYVKAYDSTAGTVTTLPWVDPNQPTSGTLTWVIGGGFIMTGGDGGNVSTIDHLNAAVCGQGLVVGSLYGPRIASVNNNGCAIGLTLGRNNSNACIGTSIDAFYVEANPICDIFSLAAADTNGSIWGHINSSFAPDLAKVKVIAVRNASGVLIGGKIGTPNGPGFTLSYNGHLYEAEGRNAFEGENSPSKTFNDQARRPRIWTMFLDSHTINIGRVGDSEYNRLFGFRGATWRYIGSGTNNAPTGTFTFNPPTKAIASSVTTNASATVTMPSTAGLIAGMPITGTGIPASTTILSINSATQITLSANATASGTITATVTGRLNGAFVAAAFSSFIGPVDFAINHKDAYQLDWNVSVVAGQVVAQVVVDVNVSTSIAPALADRQKLFRLNAGGPKTITLPSDATTAFAVGDWVEYVSTTTGAMTFAAGAGATINSPGSLLSAPRYGIVRARKSSANTWLLSGHLA